MWAEFSIVRKQRTKLALRRGLGLVDPELVTDELERSHNGALENPRACASRGHGRGRGSPPPGKARHTGNGHGGCRVTSASWPRQGTWEHDPRMERVP
jgi:hypothetical protein